MSSNGPSAGSCNPVPTPNGANEGRLSLYRRAGDALDRFFARWTTAFCVRCLEVTRRQHAEDPRADVEVIEGIFPGCCHAGVADAFWVPGWGNRGRFSPELIAEMIRVRQGVTRSAPPQYVVRERVSGAVAAGIGCGYLGPSGCGLAGTKSPLCLLYACEGVRQALAAVADEKLLGDGTDDFAGGRRTLALCAGGHLGEAAEAVASLEKRLSELERRLEASGLADGEDLYRRWIGDGEPSRIGDGGGGG